MCGGFGAAGGPPCECLLFPETCPSLVFASLSGELGSDRESMCSGALSLSRRNPRRARARQRLTLSQNSLRNSVRSRCGGAGERGWFESHCRIVLTERLRKEKGRTALSKKTVALFRGFVRRGELGQRLLGSLSHGFCEVMSSNAAPMARPTSRHACSTRDGDASSRFSGKLRVKGWSLGIRFSNTIEECLGRLRHLIEWSTSSQVRKAASRFSTESLAETPLFADGVYGSLRPLTARSGDLRVSVWTIDPSQTSLTSLPWHFKTPSGVCPNRTGRD